MPSALGVANATFVLDVTQASATLIWIIWYLQYTYRRWPDNGVKQFRTGNTPAKQPWHTEVHKRGVQEHSSAREHASGYDDARDGCTQCHALHPSFYDAAASEQVRSAAGCHRRHGQGHSPHLFWQQDLSWETKARNRSCQNPCQRMFNGMWKSCQNLVKSKDLCIDRTLCFALCLVNLVSVSIYIYIMHIVIDIVL